MIEQVHASLISQKEVAESYYELRFRWPHGAKAPKPGQFFTLKLGDGLRPLLRRPFAFSFFDPEGNEGGCIYQKRGVGTSMMTLLGESEELSMLSPLGAEFPWTTESSAPPVLIAGGVGMGPIFFLARDMRSQGLDPLVILGARSASFIPHNVEELAGGPVEVCTEDGSAGARGRVTDLVQVGSLENSGDWYACGPNPMMEAVHRLGLEKQLLGGEKNRRLWVSMEQTMGCAVGACMGCVVPVVQGPETTDGHSYARVCTEGPVFDSNHIVWEQVHG